MLSDQDKAALNTVQEALDRIGTVFLQENSLLANILDPYPGLFESFNDIFENLCDLERHIQDTLKEDTMPPVWKEDSQ